jgi:hypothetical protein
MSRIPHLPIDSNGQTLGVGDHVKFLYAPSELVDGLPATDRAAIESAVGAELKLVGFGEYGHAEVPFQDQSGRFHTIWVRPSCLELAAK